MYTSAKLLSFTALFAGIVFSAPTGTDKQDPNEANMQNVENPGLHRPGQGSNGAATPVVQYNPPGNTGLPSPNHMRVLGYKTQADCDGTKHAPLEVDPGAQELGPNACTNLLTWSTVIRQKFLGAPFMEQTFWTYTKPCEQNPGPADTTKNLAIQNADVCENPDRNFRPIDSKPTYFDLATSSPDEQPKNKQNPNLIKAICFGGLCPGIA